MKISELIKERINLYIEKIGDEELQNSRRIRKFELQGILEQAEEIEKEQEKNSLKKILEKMPIGVRLDKFGNSEKMWYEAYYNFQVGEGKTPTEALKALKEKLTLNK